MSQSPTISTFLWFNGQAEEAANVYTSLFGGRVTKVTRWSDGGPVPAGTVMTVAFELNGHRYTALNGGPMYQFTPAFSLAVSCKTQDEINQYWDALIADGGRPSRCGWLIDKFGLSWQIVPEDLGALLAGPDAKGAARAGQALMTMDKLDIAALRRAYAGE
jgi:predicted 3-demethylubiquinone-9 3-methyltransferase (glyoxalase superfamily)